MSQLMLFAEHQNIKSWCNVIYREYSMEITHKRFLFMSWDTSTNKWVQTLSMVWNFYFIHTEIFYISIERFEVNDCENTSFIQSETQVIIQYVHTHEIKDLTDSTKFRCQWRYPLLFFGYNQELSTHNNTMWLGY